MKKRMLHNCIWLFVLLALGLAGCAAEEIPYEEELPWYEQEQEDDGTQEGKLLPRQFSLAYHRSRTLDPIHCSEGAQQMVASLLYEPLFALDESFAPQKVLCDDYTVSEDGLIYLLHIRPGVFFADGSELTAKDAATTLRRAKDSQRYAARLADVLSISVKGESVQVTLSRPNTALPALLDMGVVKAGTEKEAVPAGTGPYLFMTEAESAYLSKNANWWQKKALPLERIELLEAKDADTVQYRFISREIQAYFADLTGGGDVLTGSLNCVDTPTAVLHYLGINAQNPLLSEPTVRRALQMGFDRHTVVDGYLSGHALAAQFPLSPADKDYPAELENSYRYADFRAAMETAGLTTGESRPLRLLLNEGSEEKVTIATYIARMLSAFDLDVTVEVLPWLEYQQALAAGDFDLYYGEVKLTADWDVSALIGTAGALNYGLWTNAETDALLDAHRASADRAETGAALYAHLAEQAPMIPICFENHSLLTHRDVAQPAGAVSSNVFAGFENWEISLQQESAS